MSQQDGAHLRVGDDQTDTSDAEDAPTIRGYAIDIQIIRDLQVEVDTEALRHLPPDDENPEGRNVKSSRPAV